MLVKTYTPKPQDIEHKWWIVDAEGQTLGRLASKIAPILRGKHKPIVCAEHRRGRFRDRHQLRQDRRHRQQAGREDVLSSLAAIRVDLSEINLRDNLRRFPDRPLREAVKGMLPKNALGRQMMSKLKIYAGTEHPHAAQKPTVLEL